MQGSEEMYIVYCEKGYEVVDRYMYMYVLSDSGKLTSCATFRRNTGGPD